MQRYIRPATPGDFDAVWAVLQSGRQYLKDQNLPQWQTGCGPREAEIKERLKAGESYVLILDSVVSGYTMLVPEPDGSPPMSEGAWAPCDTPYVAVHRVAMGEHCRGKGLAGGFLRDMVLIAGALGYRDIRIDTHPDNVIMQKIIQQAGFVRCGTMEKGIPGGTRWAYQIVF
ncbi:MAG: GNAT family N-acetyltransferase [Oscillospiraceae bacterium]|nr:GNAT family N-acetyltransferase [Oscillospiraceae bacterium]